MKRIVNLSSLPPGTMVKWTKFFRFGKETLRSPMTVAEHHPGYTLMVSERNQRIPFCPDLKVSVS